MTVLIFDQFEEFFFNCPNHVERKKFWDFLHCCLDDFHLPYVKVILSLREDYLHYLLECDRLTNLEVTEQDILNKKFRYAFGNFTPSAAKVVIQDLTERSFYLEPALIHELVRDLAGELQEVRPIELQVFGAQLQAENITTLDKYLQNGPKDKLVERFLEAIVKDCGAENERAAKLVLYLLTDENNTRPLKTKAELAASLAAEADKLDLVLEILVTSGVVFLIPQSPADRYQLVHDYLAAFIRQQRGAELLAELEREKERHKLLEEQRKLVEAKLNQVLKRQLREAYLAGLGLATLTFIAGIFGWQSFIANINAQINILSSSSYDNTIKLWNLDGKELKTFTGHSASVSSVSFSPDGKMIASASVDKTIKLWSMYGKEIKTFKGHSDGVISVSYSPEGKTIASASVDKTIKLWSLDSKDLKTFKAHSASINSVSYSPEGKTIASASVDKTIKLWSLDGKELRTFIGHSDLVNSVSFSPDGKTIASASVDGTIKLWSLDSTEYKTKTFKGDKNWFKWFKSVSFSPDGKTIASASVDGTIKLWNLDGKELKILAGHSNEVNSVSFSPDGKTIASASFDKTIKLWNLDGKELKTFKGHSDVVTSVSFSPDGKTIASASFDKTIKLWNLDGKELKTFKGHSDVVTSISFSPDGKAIASASGDGTIKLWSVDGKELKTFKGHKAAVSSVSFSPDGKAIASASRDGTVILWDLDLDNLVVLGCNWLEDYLPNHPETLAELQLCQNKSILMAAAPTLVTQGEELAKAGEFEKAVAKFKQAKEWNPQLDINPEAKAKEYFVKQIEEGRRQRAEGRRKIARRF